MGEAISPRVRLFPLRVRLFQDITSPWAPVGAKNYSNLLISCDFAEPGWRGGMYTAHRPGQASLSLQTLKLLLPGLGKASSISSYRKKHWLS